MEDPKQIKIVVDTYRMVFDGFFERLQGHSQTLSFQDFEDDTLEQQYDDMGYYQYHQLKEGYIDIDEEMSACFMVIESGCDESVVFQRMKSTILEYLNKKLKRLDKKKNKTVKAIANLEQIHN